MEPDKKTELLALAAIAKNIEAELQYSDQRADPNELESIRAKKFSAQEIIQRELSNSGLLQKPSTTPPSNFSAPFAPENPGISFVQNSFQQNLLIELQAIRVSFQKLIDILQEVYIKPKLEKEKRKRKRRKKIFNKNQTGKLISEPQQFILTEDIETDDNRNS